MTRKALGRGLSALLRDAEGEHEGSHPIPLDLVDPNPFQPRKAMTQDRLEELAQSIRSTGVIQPIIVRKSADRFQLIAGERRWRAARLAGLTSIPVIVRDLSDHESLELALTENALREDLSAIEMAEAYQTLQERFGYRQEDIAAKLGFDRATVANTIRLLKLPRDVQEMINKRQLTPGHARALLTCADPEEQKRLARQIVDDGLSVREAERLAAKGSQAPKVKGETDDQRVDANIRAAQYALEKALGTRVRITGDGRRGKIQISYFSAEDLQRLYSHLGGNTEARD